MIFFFFKVIFIKLKNNPFFIKEYIKKTYFYFKGSDNKISFYKSLNFMNSNETLNHIIENNLSFVRFGDGEFEILSGGTIYQAENSWYQKYNKKLQNRLKELFKYKGNNLLLGINHSLLIMTKSELKKRNIYFYFILYQSGLWKYLDKKKTYGDALVFRKDFNKLNLKSLLNHFRSKKIILITSNINKFKNINFFNNFEFISAPESDAWSKYDGILNKVLLKANLFNSKDLLILVSLGPTAKPLVLDLSENGFISWDMGHFFNFYLEDIKNLN